MNEKLRWQWQYHELGATSGGLGCKLFIMSGEYYARQVVNQL